MADEIQKPVGQLARWVDIFSEYIIDIEHRPGKLHHNADAMRRIPCHQCGKHKDLNLSSPELKLLQEEDSNTMVTQRCETFEKGHWY